LSALTRGGLLGILNGINTGPVWCLEIAFKAMQIP